jgi:DNA processing protein
MTRATIVVQAPLRSGARSAAAAARKLGRAIFAVPGWPWDPLAEGCLAEIAAGALPIISVDGLLIALGHAADPSEPAVSSDPSEKDEPTTRRPSLPPSSAPTPTLLETLPPTCKTVVEAMGERAIYVDELCAKTGLSPAVVHEALLTLTLQAVLVEGPGGQFRLASV